MEQNKFQIGDKVKFLNDIGGGIVKKIQGGMVYVQDETGFDMPFSPAELIRMADQKGVASVFNNEEIGKPKAEQKEKEEDTVFRFPTIDELEEEIKKLKSQNANLKSQIKQLQSQVLSLQRTIARIS